MNNNGFLGDYSPTVQSTVVLTPGTYQVIVRGIKEVTDRIRDLAGTIKEKAFGYNDIHMQIAVTVARLDGKPGVITNRFNTLGFKKFAEYTPAEIKRLHLTMDETTGYALDKKGNRIEDPAKTETCRNIFNGFLNTLDKDNEMQIDNFIANTVAGEPFKYEMLLGCTTEVKVINKLWEGENKPRVSSWRKRSALVTVPEEEQTEY